MKRSIESDILNILFILFAIGAILVAAGCSTTQSQYPWHGPIVDPDGNTPPVPHYETLNK